MGLFDFLKGKKKVVLSKEVEEYAQQINWDTLLKEEFKPTSMNDMLQRLALKYKELDGYVQNDITFKQTEEELNKLNEEIFRPKVDYKALFDKYLK